MVEDIRESIEATRLGFGLRPGDIDALVSDARELGVRGVCVPSLYASRAAARLRGSDILLVSVAAFPYGDVPPEWVETEIAHLATVGVAEVDVVAPLGLALAGDWDAYREWLGRAGGAARRNGVLWKAILESAALGEPVLRHAARAAVDAGADWLKTSTGFHPAGGATEEAVRILREVAPEGVGVKASGGIRDRATASRMVAAGADRIGTSAARAVVTG